MKMLLIFGMMFCASALLADSWTDPTTGITWKYKITNEAAKEASLGDNGSCISTATAGYLVVPERINGYAIVEVGNGAFNSCSKLTGITLPSTLRTVVNTWFSGLTSVQILKSPAEMENLFPNGVSSSSALREIYTGSRPFDVRISKKLVRIYCLPKYKKLWEDQIRADTSDQTNTYPPAGQIELIPMGNSVKVIPSVHNAGVIKRNTLPTIDNLYDWGASVSVTATPKEGYVFLGWSSDVEGVSGADATLTFTMPERDVILIANFFPKTLIQTIVKESVDSEVDAGTIAGAADIEKLVKEEVQKQAEPFKQAGVEEALKNGAVQPKGN